MRWIERILDRKVKLQDYRYQAQGWDTCAVGEVVADFPNVVLVDQRSLTARSRNPLDRRLNKLGLDFSRAVADGDRKRALKIYDAIQMRVRTLIRKAAA